MNASLSCPYPTVPVFVISMKREGNCLRPWFGSGKYISDFGNLFDGEHEFAKFQQILLQQDAKYAIPNPEVQTGILTEFLQQKMDGRTPFGFIHISYDEIRQFSKNAGEADSAELPVLVDWLAQNRYPVIHILRNNALDCFIETTFANNQPADDPALKLNVDESVREIRQMQIDVECFRNWLVGTNRVEFFVESIVREGRISELVVHQICKHLELDARLIDKTKTKEYSVKDDFQSCQIKSLLRPALIRAGYENLIQLPRAA